MITLRDAMPSFQEHRLDVPVREGFIACNGSVAVHDGQTLLAVNAIDHYLDEQGFFRPLDPGHNPRKAALNLTYLVSLKPDMTVAWTTELCSPEIVDPPAWQFRGFECPRLFVWRGALHIAACSSGTGSDPGAIFYMARIDGDKIVNVHQLKPEHPMHAEKNWMPEVVGDDLRFHYRLGTLIGPTGAQWKPGGRDDLDLHGGTQVVPFGDGALCIAHSYRPVADTYRKVSRQHFVRLDRDGRPLTISPAVVFGEGRLEIACGMAHAGGDMLVSYGRVNADPAMPHQERPFIARFKTSELGSIVT